MSAEIKQEQARQQLATTSGLLSKSADSDTLIVDLIKDRLSLRKDEVAFPSQKVEDRIEIFVSQKDEGKRDRNTQMGTSVGIISSVSIS